jgi:hypothetical protein
MQDARSDVETALSVHNRTESGACVELRTPIAIAVLI